MDRAQRRKGFWIGFLMLSVGLTGYFAYHAVHGQHGLRSRAQIEKRIEALEAEHKLLSTERERLERQAAAITAGEGRNDDLIEEQARAILNYASPGDVILIIPDKSEKP